MVALLADLDSRLQSLQRELEDLATPELAPPPPPAPAVAAPPVRLPEPIPTAEDVPVVPRTLRWRSATAARNGNGAPLPRLVPAAELAIREAEQEARDVVDAARVRLAEIAATARERLAPPPSAPPAARPATRNLGFRAAQRQYSGTLLVDAGPFGDVAQLSEFERALAAVPGVEDVYIQALDGERAAFEVRFAMPTLLVPELQSRLTSTLRISEATDHRLSLDVDRG